MSRSAKSGAKPAATPRAQPAPRTAPDFLPAIELTNREAQLIRRGFLTFAAFRGTTGVLAYRLRRIRRAMTPIWEDYDAEQERIFEEFAEKTADGEYKTEPVKGGGQLVLFRQDVKAEASARQHTLDVEKVQLPAGCPPLTEAVFTGSGFIPTEEELRFFGPLFWDDDDTAAGD